MESLLQGGLLHLVGALVTGNRLRHEVEALESLGGDEVRVGVRVVPYDVEERLSDAESREC